jgi:hypothetical protein
MMTLRTLLLSASVLAASTHSGLATPCSAELDQLQARVDARLDTTAAAGPTGMESVGAKLHHQPTPGSISRAEQGLGEGTDLGQAVADLEHDRALDQAGDRAACERSVEEVRRALER